MPLQIRFESSTFYFYDLLNNAGNGENKTQTLCEVWCRKRGKKREIKGEGISCTHIDTY